MQCIKEIPNNGFFIKHCLLLIFLIKLYSFKFNRKYAKLNRNACHTLIKNNILIFSIKFS